MLAESDKHKKEIGELTLPGYDFCHIPRPSRGGGVALIHKKTISRSTCSNYEASSFESLCCDLTFKDHKSPIKLVIIYRLHYSVKHRVTSKMFFDEFSTYLSLLTTSACKLLLVGDFNFHWNVPSDPDTIKLKDLLQTFNLTQFVTDPIPTLVVTPWISLLLALMTTLLILRMRHISSLIMLLFIVK